MADLLGPYVMTFLVLRGIAKAVSIVALLGFAALLFTLLDTILECAMGD